MKHFNSRGDVDSMEDLLAKMDEAKAHPNQWQQAGKGKAIGLLFFNPSLRTRMSTERAAGLLGLQVITLNVHADSWNLEFEDGTIMDGHKAEHIKDAAQVMGHYVDLLAIRSFPTLTDRPWDYSEAVLQAFQEYAGVPILNLESATLHPLQSLTDIYTIERHKTKAKPKVALTWAPHTKALPQSVANSFLQWASMEDYELVLTHPKGYELQEEFEKLAAFEANQAQALAGADFVYAKNWSAFEPYGDTSTAHKEWIVDGAKMEQSNAAHFMHCMPIRRNVVATDAVIDSAQSLMIEQAQNRLYAAQAVLKTLLEHG